MVHGLFRASGIVMIYRLHHTFSRILAIRGAGQNARVIFREQGWVTSRLFRNFGARAPAEKAT
jgi:hypothetical protein